MDPNRRITKKFTKKFDSKVIKWVSLAQTANQGSKI